MGGDLTRLGGGASGGVSQPAVAREVSYAEAKNTLITALDGDGSVDQLFKDGGVTLPDGRSAKFESNTEFYSGALKLCTELLQASAKTGGDDAQKARYRSVLLHLLQKYPKMKEKVLTEVEAAQTALRETAEGLAGRVSQGTTGRAEDLGGIWSKIRGVFQRIASAIAVAKTPPAKTSTLVSTPGKSSEPHDYIDFKDINIKTEEMISKYNLRLSDAFKADFQKVQDLVVPIGFSPDDQKTAAFKGITALVEKAKNRDEKRVVRALYTAAAIACDLTRAQFVSEDVRDAHADARMKVESMPSEKKTAASDAGVQEGSFVTTAAPPATTAVPAPVTPQPSVQDTRPPARHTPPPR